MENSFAEIRTQGLLRSGTLTTAPQIVASTTLKTTIDNYLPSEDLVATDHAPPKYSIAKLEETCRKGRFIKIKLGVE